jgi:hypothetical protein
MYTTTYLIFAAVITMGTTDIATTFAPTVLGTVVFIDFSVKSLVHNFSVTVPAATVNLTEK